MFNRQNGHDIACLCVPCIMYWDSDQMVDDWPQPAPPAKCVHIIHEWPVTGPWMDYMCVHCGQSWRIPISNAWGPVGATP